MPCPDTGSCAAYEAGLDVVTGAPDFATSNHANQVAADVAERMQATLQHRPSFVGMAIVADGLEVVLHTTTTVDEERAVADRAFASARASVPAADRSLAARARLHTTFVQHSAKALERLTQQIAHDRAWQSAHDIELSSWSPDSATDSVRIFIRHYSDAAAIQLIKRYGTAVTVSTKDTPFAQAD